MSRGRPAQAAFQTHDDTSTLKFLFTASDKSNTVVQRADQRNVQGMLLFHPILLKAPWEVSSSIDADIDLLIQEKSPLVHARANSMGPLNSGASSWYSLGIKSRKNT